MTTLTDALVAPALTRDPAAPLMTYYDDATGERTELSGVTLTNWAAKAANMIRDEFGVLPGDSVAISLPAHWQTAGIVLGAWWAGAEVVFGTADAVVAFTTIDQIDDVSADEVAAVSLHPMGMGLGEVPIGITDYATAVRVHGDQFVGAPAHQTPFPGVSIDDVLARSAALSPGGRLLSHRDWRTSDDLIDGFCAPLAAGASLVQVAHPDAHREESRRQSEKITGTID